MTMINYIVIATAIVGLAGGLVKLLRQIRNLRSNRRTVFQTGMEWHGEPPIIVNGWFEADGTFTPNTLRGRLSRAIKEILSIVIWVLAAIGFVIYVQYYLG